MSILKLILNNIAEMYYPIGLCSTKDYDKYIESFEYKKLKRTLNECFIFTEKKGVREKLMNEFKKNKELKDVKDFTLESFDNCLTFKIEFYDKNVLYQICVNISLLVPYYIVYVLKNNIDMNSNQWINLPVRKLDLERTMFNNHINLVSSIVEKETNYSKFPCFLINSIIPNINSSDIELGSFTYLNAFFLLDIKL